MVFNRTLTALAVAAGLGLAAGAALGADTAPAPTTPGGKALVARQARFKEQNATFKAINDEVRKDAPDKALLAAKAEIWTDAEGFAAAATNFQTESAKLEQVALAGDMDAIKAQVRATGGACKTCHDKFRAPDQH